MCGEVDCGIYDALCNSVRAIHWLAGRSGRKKNRNKRLIDIERCGLQDNSEKIHKQQQSFIANENDTNYYTHHSIDANEIRAAALASLSFYLSSSFT